MASDFSFLAEASGALVQQLRRDEQAPELSDQLADNSGPPAHNYFVEPFSPWEWGARAVHDRVIPVPPQVTDQYSRLECMSFMGLLPEIGHAWVSIDNRLFLWDYESESGDEFQQFTGLEQVIVSVALVPPRPGLFKDVVRYLLVVSTPVEIVLLAVTYESGQGGCVGPMKLRPTAFRASSDRVSMLRICGHPNGRIFMAGQDGRLYELHYDTDQGLLYTYLGLGSGEGVRKCVKVDVSSSLPGAGLVPGFVRSLVPSRQSSLVDLAIDPLRNALYTLDTNGALDLYDLGSDGQQVHHRVHHFDVWAGAREMCARASRWGNRAHDLPEARTFAPGHGFSLVSIHIIDPSESSRCHLVAISDAGFRFYLTTYRGGGNSYSARSPRPTSLSILHIRAPPPTQLRSFLQKAAEASAQGGATGARDAQPPEGFSPSYARGGGALSAPRKVHSGYYCGGVTIMVEGKGDDPDSLLVIGPDLTNRRAASADGCTEELPTMRETVCEIGREWSGALMYGKVWAIAERPRMLHNLSFSHLAVLSSTSRTPSDFDISRRISSAEAQQRQVETALSTASTGISPSPASMSPSFKFFPAMGQQNNSGSSCMVARAREWRDAADTSPRRVSCAPPQCLPCAGSGWDCGLTPADLRHLSILNELTTQCGPADPPRSFLCLTNAGLHAIRWLRPIDHLFSLLWYEKLEQVRTFFLHFGREQASAMCFAIACGCCSPLETSSSPSVGSREEVVRRALTAIHQHGGQPRVSSAEEAAAAAMPTSDTNGFGRRISATASLPVSMPARAVLLDEFSFSFHHNGLVLFLSRLLRPVWFKPVVSAEIAEPKSSPGLKRAANGSKKPVLKPLLHPSELRAVYQPLRNLQSAMTELYPQTASPGASELFGTRGGTPITPEEGRRLEYQSLHRLYRLVSRAAQGAALLNLLSDVGERQPHAVVGWEKLEGMLFWELVTSPLAHSIVTSTLTALLQPSSGLDTGLSDQYAAELERSCFHYFSPGDRLTYEGRRCLHRAAGGYEGAGTEGDQSLDRTAELERGISLLTHGASYWRSPSDVAPGGRLDSVIEALSRMGRPDGVVNVCLVCASNFGPNPPEADSALAGDKGLYHGGLVSGEAEKAAAKLRCYGGILTTLEGLLRPARRLVGAGSVLPSEQDQPADNGALEMDGHRADAVLARALRSEDVEFHTALYDFLRERDPSRLVRIRSPFIEPYLRGADALLLYKHYSLHGLHTEAVELMSTLSHTQDSTPITERVLYLTRAISSAKIAAAEGMFPQEQLAQLEDELEVALLQRRVLERLSDGPGGVSADGDEMNRLRGQLLGVSEIFNDYAQARGLWDLCLSILHVCNLDQPDVVRDLWRSILYRLVPRRTCSPVTGQWLINQRQGLLLDPPGFPLPAGSTVADDVLFEDTTWILPLRNRVENLAKELYEGGAGLAFPLILIVDELEGINGHMLAGQAQAQSPHWVVECLRAGGVAWPALLQAYDASLDLCEKRSAASQLHILRELAEIISRWSREAIPSPQGSPVRESEVLQELLLTNRNGELERRLQHYRVQLQALHGEGIHPRDTQQCVEEFAASERRIVGGA